MLISGSLMLIMICKFVLREKWLAYRNELIKAVAEVFSIIFNDLFLFFPSIYVYKKNASMIT